MARTVLIACLPWVGFLAILVAVLFALLRWNRARPDWRRLAWLHRDQTGSVQSLSFVLTVPLFVWVILFIVQVTQLMIATVVVHYAAYAAARSAMVWIPQRIGDAEAENWFSWYVPDPEAPQQFPVLDPGQPGYGPGAGGVTYLVQPTSLKYRKVRQAALAAVAPICPSRDLGLPVDAEVAQLAGLMERAFAALAPGRSVPGAILPRLRNKLAYAAGTLELQRWDEALGGWVFEDVPLTQVQVRFFHPNIEPPLVPWYIGPNWEEFFPGVELGWQDHVTVTVTHQLALLPGPGQLLASRVLRHPGHVQDALSRRIAEGQSGGQRVYVYPLTATATLGIEGEKSVLSYVYPADIVAGQ